MFTLPTLNLFLFVGLVFTMAGLTLLTVHRAGRPNNEPSSTSQRWTLFTGIGLALWLIVTFILAKRGVAADFSRFPSPFMLVLAGFTIFNILLNAVSPFGKRLASGLSLYTLFGFQVFRLLLEITLMLFHKQGLAPIQVTLEGRNWDILTGLLALGVLLLYKNKPLSNGTYFTLNLIGFALVLNIVAVSILSLPIPIRAFTEDNTWITQAPFIWLPTFLVQLAIAGHILSFRKLLMERALSPNMKLAEAK